MYTHYYEITDWKQLSKNLNDKFYQIQNNSQQLKVNK